MSDAGDYELIVTPPAARAIAEQLPEAVAAAVIEFLTRTLIREPHRVGKPFAVSWRGSGRHAAGHIAFSTESVTTHAKLSCYESSTAATSTDNTDRKPRSRLTSALGRDCEFDARDASGVGPRPWRQLRNIGTDLRVQNLLATVILPAIRLLWLALPEVA